MEQPEAQPPAENPTAAVALTLYLLRGVSQFRVFQQMCQRYPTEEALQTLLSSREYLELVDEVATIFTDIRTDLDVLGDLVDPGTFGTAVELHYPRALEACDELAKMLGVDPDDLLSVLITA